MSVPTRGEEYEKAMEALARAQEAFAMLGHLAMANDEKVHAMAWLTLSEVMKETQRRVTKLATKRLQ